MLSQILLPEPVHRVTCQAITFSEQAVGFGFQVAIGDRVEQHLVSEMDVFPGAGADR